ncbi:MAG: IPT/TIG domain-containing protein [Candidatus Manganitrophus sp. SB1]|nr:IPT/TIG domain-containing protein [Candidatus Manganitrophus morganii]
MKKVWIVWSAVLFSLFLITGCGSLSQGSAESADPAAPIVTGVSPTEAKVGEEIRVTGERFGTGQGNSSLIVGGAAATQIVSWSDTEIIAVVPEDASSGSVKVVIGGAESSPGFLAVLWTQGNPENVAISAAASDQQSPQAVSDGIGGMIIAWMDIRSGTSFDIYAQRVNGSGTVQWTSDGVPISTVAGSQQHPQIISDGAGGAIITWQDDRDGNLDIYAQRINRDGVVQWAVDGIAVAAGGHAEFSPQIVLDGAGGAIIAWQDDRNGKIDVYAHRVNANGAVQWATGGVVVSTAATNKFFFRLISDGAGGAVLVWQDDRGGDWDLYAQRINRNGAVRWSADGVAVSIAANTQGAPQLVSDGTGGAIIVWQDDRDGAWDVYAQRVNGSGTAAWTADGVIISNAANDQLAPRPVSDGAGGAIMTWQDGSGQTVFDVRAQRVDGSGAAHWAAGGVVISSAPDIQGMPQLETDSAGGAIIAWQDLRGGSWDLYAQRVNEVGEVQWSIDGVAISTAPGDQKVPLLISDGAGGAAVVWEDSRNGTDAIPSWDIYAQGITAGGKQ